MLCRVCIYLSNLTVPACLLGEFPTTHDDKIYLSYQNDFVGVYRQHDEDYFDKGQNPWQDLYGDEARDKCDADLKSNYIKYWGALANWQQPNDITDEEWHDITTYRLTASTNPVAIEID